MFKRNALLAVLAAATLAACSSDKTASDAKPVKTARVTITDFGAVADGKTVNTISIQKAIDQTAASGGGTVVVPSGTFMSGSLFMKPGVDLVIEKDGVIKGTEDLKDYPKMMTRIEGHFQEWVPALINADKVDHLRITGEGTLDGSGAVYYAAFRKKVQEVRGTKNLDVDRPRLMFIRDSKDVQVKGLHFLNSGFWNLHLYRCDGVLVEGLDIRALAGSPSTDGTDVDSSRNVTIKGVYYSVNDDCIALKGSKGIHADQDKDSPPVEHIRIVDCTFAAGGSFVTAGSEATIVRDVVVENCKAVPPGNMAIIRLKLRTDTPQLYEDIHVRNVTLDGRGSLINMSPWTQYEDLQGQPKPTHTVRNISMSGITGTFGSFGMIRPNPGDSIEDLTLENIDVKLTGGQGGGRGGATPAGAPSAANAPQPNLDAVKNLVVKNVILNGVELKGR